ncbi:Zinc metalloproteinase nas-7 [Nymphon striatum]|nr:Zinc metalloproteinase nas-7 [Nymphon striatum]
MYRSFLLGFISVSVIYGAVVKREVFQVKSSEGEEEEFKNDIIGEPLSDEDFKRAETITDKDEDEIDEMRAQGNIDPILLAGLFEGDIRGINSTESRNGILSAYQKWPNAVIPYVISRHYNSAERAVIAKAMKFYLTYTCVKFTPRTNQRDYIHITRGSGCSSHVGRRGGVQYVSLGYGCVASGTVQHELMHAAGFWHEQSRHDRDKYVKIIWTNIVAGMKFNFQKISSRTSQTFGESYDYNSLMHYNAYAFTKYRGRATIVPKQKGATIGNRRQLSTIDLAKLNKLYQCSGTVTTGTKATTKRPKVTKFTTKPTRVTKAPVTDDGSLVDRNRNCRYWASAGQCKVRLQNPGQLQPLQLCLLFGLIFMNRFPNA